MGFWKKLAFELVHNPWDTDRIEKNVGDRRIMRSNMAHELILAPKIPNGQTVGGKNGIK